MNHWRLLIVSLAWGSTFSFSSALAQPTVETSIDFARSIQPILSENCYFCHGPDEAQRKAGLRLDREADAAWTITPGSADDSELIRRLESADPEEKMPPPDSHRQLSAPQIALIRRWVDQGATWQQHWAFAPLTRPTLPEGSAAGHPIDRLIRRRLADRGWDLSPTADRRTLVRRVAIDLTGLPPTATAVQDYLRDQEPDAYLRMVDRFLDSPAFGERMAWNWLEAARYADSNGYQQDRERTMWPWRDWIVRAFNENLPFDQFSIWQLAGDQLPNASHEQILATGFNRNHPINGEGGRIPAENRVDYVMDMTETTATVWLGLTMNCCRCHDHKYDQLSQRDYYRLSAFFNQTPVTGAGGNPQTPPVLAVPNPDQERQRLALIGKLDRLQQQRQQRVDELVSQQAVWERATLASDSPDHWQPLDPTTLSATGAELKQLDDQSVLAAGPSLPVERYQVTAPSPLREIRGLRLEALPHASMTGGGLSRSASSNFVLTDVQLFVKEPGQPRRRLKLESAEADFAQPGHAAALAIDDGPKTGWAVWSKDKAMTQSHQAVFLLDHAVSIPATATLTVVLDHQSVHDQHNLGRFRLSVTDAAQPALARLTPELRTALNTPPEQRGPEQQQLIRKQLIDTDTTLQKLDAERQAIFDRQKQLDSEIPQVMVMRDREQPRPTHVLTRGSYEQPGTEVQAGVPARFSQLPSDQPANRLALARWLFQPDHPLTARVAVNRIWAQIFGTGLVKTSEDFGVQGEPPSHPELLDWLACEYRDSGWDTKHLIRTIVRSQTYRQTSHQIAAHREPDPDNRLLSYSPRYRLPSWMIRDYVLAAAGQLQRQIGGPPVYPYQPQGVWAESSFGKKVYQPSNGDDLYRRSLYTFWRRIAPPTLLFDTSDRMSCAVNRNQTNTPLHALATLNDVTYVEAARLLATRVIDQTSGAEFEGLSPAQRDRARIEQIFERLLIRLPDETERQILTAALDRSRREYGAQPALATALLSTGQAPVPESIDEIQLASWTSLTLALINLDETITRP